MIETQYIDLFTQHRKTIDEHSAKVLNDQRNKAFEVFRELGLPSRKLEDFQYSDVAKEFDHDFGINLKQLVPEVNPYTAYGCNVANLSTDLYFIMNDSFYKKDQPELKYPKGVFVGSLKDFAEQQPELCAKYYGQIATSDKNGVIAFNTMFAQDGFVVYVPDNTVLEHPIQLINILTGKVDFMANRRVLLIGGKNAEFKVLACDHTVDGHKFLATQVVEIYADENAHIDFYEVEESSEKTIRLSNIFSQIEKSANVLVNNITLQCGFTRNNYHVRLNGEYADGSMCGVVIADKEQHVDNFIFIDHAKPNCHSNQLFKYVLQESSTGVFCGRILVAEDAQKTLAYQSNNNLCSSPTAKMYSKPQLEIYADDVKCSHGLTTGQLDEDALFYLRARGISKEDAKLLLMQAFTSGVIDLIRLDVLKVRLLELIEKRFRGESARCGNCAICK